jgi:hypothetical protein
MKLFKLISATALSTAVMLIMSSPVGAQVVEQSQDLDLDTEVSVSCTSGSYGQNLNCTADASGSASGSQSQRVDLGGNRRVVFRADGTPVFIHTAANTALDFNTMAVAMGTMLSGAAGAVIKIKSRA